MKHHQLNEDTNDTPIPKVSSSSHLLGPASSGASHGSSSVSELSSGVNEASPFPQYNSTTPDDDIEVEIPSLHDGGSVTKRERHVENSLSSTSTGAEHRRSSSPPRVTIPPPQQPQQPFQSGRKYSSEESCTSPVSATPLLGKNHIPGSSPEDQDGSRKQIPHQAGVTLRTSSSSQQLQQQQLPNMKTATRVQYPTSVDTPSVTGPTFSKLPLKKQKVSLLRLALATVCFAGLQFGWALQIALLTPFMLELGLPDFLVSLIWLCGPVAGLIIQPLVGNLSDKYNTPIGRRSPWILGGAVFVVVALLLIPNSPDLGCLLVKEESGNWLTLILATAGFWILDIANNAMQGPCRALLADIAPNSQQATGNAIFSVWLALGNVTGYTAGFINWSKWTGFSETEVCREACVNLRTAFLISIVFLTVTTLISLLFARERKSTQRPARLNEEYADEMRRQMSRESSPSSSRRKGNFMVRLCRKIIFDNPATVIALKMISLPWNMKYVLLVTFFSWFGWFAFLIYITHWTGLIVFQGSPESDGHARYEEGVRWGAIGLAGNAAISFFFSPIVPYLIRLLGHRYVWFAGQLCLCGSLILPAFVTNKWAALAVISSFGIPWSITMTVPFALAAIMASDEDKGIYMGILNIAVTAPQLVLSALGPVFSWLFNSNPVAPLAAGGVSALLSAILCFLLIPSTPTRNPIRKKGKFSTTLNVSEEDSIVDDSDEEFEKHLCPSNFIETSCVNSPEGDSPIVVDDRAEWKV